ncbi:FAD-binding oxidoreductase [Pseudomonas sp. HR96]|uniref:NAD(P)/FAD-dependent oxidoreductase n=1 Tax=Pseudomonas sp. HR96 TaxID=1027966 RepID=UPI002A74A6AD|nr:FAD-binding oxidoreductase [Pseudomonas sp. HR96]WPO98066.1 FAD-binding oxidoreductase [Pseudomonas sp. HR96]
MSYINTYYSATTEPGPARPGVQGQVDADVCVVGGGLTGVNTALELAERGLSVVLLEARRIGWAASGRNGGQLIRGLGHDIEHLRGRLGDDGVRFMQQAGFESVEIVRQRIERHAIDCDLRWGYCDLANTPAHWRGLQAEQQNLLAQGYRHKLQLVAPQRMHEVVDSAAYAGGLIDMGSGHLHPLKLLLGEAAAAEAQGARLFENSAVRRIVHGPQVEVHTDQGCVRAGQLVLGCDAFLDDLEPSLSGKVLAAGSYVIATEPLGQARAEQLIPQNLALCDQRVTVDYYRRTSDHRLLFGGACHYSGRDPADIGQYMRGKMEKVFPQLRGVGIDHAWSGLIGIGANRFPQIGRLKAQRNVFYAQGYSGHGLNVTHYAARVLADAIAANDQRALELFERVPHRTFPGGKALRSPLLALGMLWYRMKEWV